MPSRSGGPGEHEREGRLLALDLPVRIDAITLRLERPLDLPPRPGASLATTLRGAFESTLLHRACKTGFCWRSEPARCSEPGVCPVGWLYKPRSLVLQRDLPTPVGMWVERWADDFVEVTRVLWGERAQGLLATIEDVLHALGRQGLRDQSGRARFRADTRNVFLGTLAEWANRLGHPRELILELRTPCATPDPSPPAIAGNVACELVLWRLEDTGRSAQLGREQCDELADAGRRGAVAAFDGVEIDGLLVREEQGRRRSRENAEVFPLGGVRGTYRLAGDLTAALPWLAALALRGAGQKRSFGLGAVRLWCPSPPAPQRRPAGALLNLSNHPVSTWPAEQLEAARELGLGVPLDLPGGMPTVPAAASTEDIRRAARVIAVDAVRSGASAAVVATDPVLVFALVTELQTLGVRCFAPASNRDAREEQRGDGSRQKISVFRFAGWREYPC